MRRDMDLVRTILKGIADASGDVPASVFVTERHDFDEVAYHFDIMQQADLIDASLVRSASGSIVRADAYALTWEGNDFLDSVRSDKVWSKVKERIGGTVGTVSLAVIKEVAVSIAKTMLGL